MIQYMQESYSICSICYSICKKELCFSHKKENKAGLEGRVGEELIFILIFEWTVSFIQGQSEA